MVNYLTGPTIADSGGKAGGKAGTSNGGGTKKKKKDTSTAYTYSGGGKTGTGKVSGGGGGGGGGGTSKGKTTDPNAYAKSRDKKAESEAKKRSKRENANTRRAADAQYKLLGSFKKQRDTKLKNITRGLTDSDRMLLKGYYASMRGLKGSLKDNDKAEASASNQNILNASRERAEIMGEVSLQGGGESDRMRAQLSALRNFNANQSEVNRSFFDTLRSVNNSIIGLNTDTATSRVNLYNQSEADREAAYANYYNQIADTWTQIGNIENSNTNVKTDSSEAYKKKYGTAADKAKDATAKSYTRKSQTAQRTWNGKTGQQGRKLNTSNRAGLVTIGEPVVAPEGSTLRKW